MVDKDLLLGEDELCKVPQGDKLAIHEGSPLLCYTTLGWIVSGIVYQNKGSHFNEPHFPVPVY